MCLRSKNKYVTATILAGNIENLVSKHRDIKRTNNNVVLILL